MRINDLIRQLEASDAFSNTDNSEVNVVVEDNETFEVFEVIYNSVEDRVDILIYDRLAKPVTKDLPHGIEDEL